MNEVDKGKLKVLIKMILISKSPNYLTSNQIASIINEYDWGFKTNINSVKVGRLLSYELKKTNSHFLMNIESKKERGISYYMFNKSNR